MTTIDHTVNDHLSRDELFAKVDAFFADSPSLHSIEVPFLGNMITFKRMESGRVAFSVPVTVIATGLPFVWEGDIKS